MAVDAVACLWMRTGGAAVTLQVASTLQYATPHARVRALYAYLEIGRHWAARKTCLPPDNCTVVLLHRLPTAGRCLP